RRLDLFGVLREHGRIGHPPRMRAQLFSFVTRNDVEVQVEDGLTRGGIVELRDTDAVGLERPLYGSRHDLCRFDELGERARFDVEEIARLHLRDYERVPVGLRHGVHEGEHMLGFVYLRGWNLAT